MPRIEDTDDDTDDEIIEEEEVLNREDLLRQIEEYYREFPDILNSKETKKAQESVKKVRSRYSEATPTEKIKEDLDLIKVAVAGKNMAGTLSGLCVPAAMIIEHVGEHMGLKLKGPSESLSAVVYTNRAVFESCIKELVCKYGLGGYMQPEVRLAMALGSCVMSVHTKNDTAEKIRQPQPIANSQQENNEPYKE